MIDKEEWKGKFKFETEQSYFILKASYFKPQWAGDYKESVDMNTFSANFE